MTLPELIQSIFAIAAFIGAGAVIVRFGIACYRLARRVESTFELVNSELRPNGGSSLHDAIKRIDHRVEVLEQIDRRGDGARRETDATESGPL